MTLLLLNQSSSADPSDIIYEAPAVAARGLAGWRCAASSRFGSSSSTEGGTRERVADMALERGDQIDYTSIDDSNDEAM